MEYKYRVYTHRMLHGSVYRVQYHYSNWQTIYESRSMERAYAVLAALMNITSQIYLSDVYVPND